MLEGILGPPLGIPGPPGAWGPEPGVICLGSAGPPFFTADPVPSEPGFCAGIPGPPGAWGPEPGIMGARGPPGIIPEGIPLISGPIAPGSGIPLGPNCMPGCIPGCMPGCILGPKPGGIPGKLEGIPGRSGPFAPKIENFHVNSRNLISNS